MGNKKYVHLVFMVGAVLLSWLMIQVTELAWTYFGPPNELYARFIGMGLGILFVGRYWMKASSFEKVSTIVHELSRVSWPTKKETKSATYVVIITVLIASVIMFSFDWFWSFVTDKVLSA